MFQSWLTTMTRGILVFARNNSQIDYTKQAHFLAQRAKKFLDLPTTLVTDSIDYLDIEYPDWRSVFDQVIKIVWNSADADENSVLISRETHSQRSFNDGTVVSKQLEWKNELRSKAYDLSPYDETLVLDTDIVICNDNFAKCFEQTPNLLLYSQCTELNNLDRGDEFARISDTSVDFYWATAIFFRKTPENKIFFDLVKHIQENWTHYKRVFQINSAVFRNDYAFSIAIHIMNGYQPGNFAKPMPGKLYFVTDKSLLWNVDDTSLLFLVEKPKNNREYTALRVKNSNVHVMNKFSLNRCIDES